MRDYKRLVPTSNELKTLRDCVREHLNHAKITQEKLAEIWEMHPASARRLLNPHKTRPNIITPEHLKALIQALRLDADDARELYWIAALEAGYKIGKLPTG